MEGLPAGTPTCTLPLMTTPPADVKAPHKPIHRLVADDLCSCGLTSGDPSKMAAHMQRVEAWLADRRKARA